MHSSLYERRVDPQVEAALEPQTHYRSVTRLAVLSLVAALPGLLAFVDWKLMVFPSLALLFGGLALRRIRRSPDRFTGSSLAIGSMVFAVVTGAGGAAWLTCAGGRDVPPGYQLVTYPELDPDPDKPGELIPPRAFELDKLCAENKTKVFIKGFMYPGKIYQHIKQFVVSRDNGNCKFCMPNPRPTDLILVKLQGDLEVDYTPHLLHLGGKFVLDEKELQKMGGIVYRLEADYVR